MKRRKYDISNGLPAKSYIYIMSIDYHLTQLLSILNNVGVLDSVLESCISWRRNSKIRLSITNMYLKYLACYEESERITFILNSKFISRLLLISKLNEISEYKLLSIPMINKLNSSYLFVTSFKLILAEIKQIYLILYANYKHFIIPKLTSGRKKNHEVNYVDCYCVLVNMIDSYIWQKSKVPFYKYLTFFCKNYKGKTISFETENLESGIKVPLEAVNTTLVADPVFTNCSSSEQISELSELLGSLPVDLRNFTILYYNLQELS